MNLRAISRILGVLLMLFSLTILVPIGISFLYQDSAASAFILALTINLAIGLSCWYPNRHQRQDLRVRDGFLIVTLFWVVLCLSGAIPFMLADHPHMNITDSVFESVSGLTTTGATVITRLDDLPKSILFYRQQLQWLGGMGFVVLAVAILPMLGVGGMQLFRAELPGPFKESKLTPRITGTAKALWYIYVGLTVMCALLYWLAGMTPFDAISHSFSTIATGGFSTHDSSIGYFNSRSIETIAICFMLISSVGFSLHFYALKNFSLAHYGKDSEFKLYTILMAVATFLVAAILIHTHTYNFGESLGDALFQVVSILSTTGYTNVNFTLWPSFLPIFVIILSFIGGCAGSTSGGIKVIRCLLVWKQGVRELFRLLHPNAVSPIKLAKKAVSDRIVEAIWGFIALYILVFVLVLLALLATGLDFLSAFSATTSAINNLGPALGVSANHFAYVGDTAKWILSITMLLGRLEIFTVLVLFSVWFWRS